MVFFKIVMVFNQQILSSWLEVISLWAFIDCYCTVYVYVVILVTVSECSFWVEVNVWRIFLLCLYLYFRWWFIYQERVKNWDPINQFNPATFLFQSKTKTWISNVMVFFYVLSFEVRSDCSFHWYWWNWWPSPFKFSLYKHINT